MSGEEPRKWVKARFPEKPLGESSYDIWTSEEDEKLLHALHADMSVLEISKVHQRTVRAINSRIRRRYLSA